MGWLFPIYGRIFNTFQTTNQNPRFKELPAGEPLSAEGLGGLAETVENSPESTGSPKICGT
jgi:hypothetical protein